jgi:F-type H+-transporting ATPase subunit b
VGLVVARPVLAQQAEAPTAHGETAAASSAEAHEEGMLPTVARVVNFAALVGILVYFLRGPIVQYLAGRRETIRKDLVDAQETRNAAASQLNSIRARLAELPGELDALRARGKADLADERVRMQAALVERTRREIDLQFRIARRELMVHTADLTTSLAKARIERSITAEDQARLVDRYTAEVRA